MQIAQRVAKNTGILYAKMAITVFISLYSTRLILAALGVKDFGIFNLVAGTVAMLGFLNASMASATQRFMSFEQGAGNNLRVSQIFNVSFVLHLIIALLLLIVLEIAGYFFFNGILNIPIEKIHSAKLVYQFMIVTTLFTIISVPYDAVINSRENMFLFAVLGIVEAILKLFIALYIAYIPSGRLVIYGLLMAALSVFLLIVRFCFCFNRYNESKIDIRKNYDKKLMKEMTSFAGWSFLGLSTGMLANYGQGIMLNIFFGTSVNAAQGIANQVSGQLGVFAGTMLKALNPIIDKSEGAGNRALMLKTSILGSKVSFFLLSIMYLPVLIETPYILKIWLKHVPDYAVIFCRLLLLRFLLEQLFTTLNSSIVAVGNIKRFQLYLSILNFFPLFIGYLLFKQHYPPYSLYVAFIIYALLSSSLILHFSNKNCGLSISFFLKDVVLKCIFIFTLIFTISYIPTIILKEGLIRLFLVSTISSVLFLVLVYFTGFSFEERQGIINVINLTLKKIHFKKMLSEKNL